VKAYLEAENTYTDAVMKPTEGLQKKLYDEMLSRIKGNRRGGSLQRRRLLLLSADRGRQTIRHSLPEKRQLGRSGRDCSGRDELAKGQKFMSLGAFDVSDDGNLLAYTTDNTGFRQFTLAVKDLRTGKLLADHAERVDSIAWANDNKTIFSIPLKTKSPSGPTGCIVTMSAQPAPIL